MSELRHVFRGHILAKFVFWMRPAFCAAHTSTQLVYIMLYFISMHYFTLCHTVQNTILYQHQRLDRDNPVGTATRYRLDGPGIESLWGRDFPQPSNRLRSPPSLPYNEYRVSFPQIKRPERGVNHPPPSSAIVKKRVYPYPYSPSGHSWLVLDWTLLLELTFTRPDFVRSYKDGAVSIWQLQEPGFESLISIARTGKNPTYVHSSPWLPWRHRLEVVEALLNKRENARRPLGIPKALHNMDSQLSSSITSVKFRPY